MKLVYTGIECASLTHGGEYEIIKSVLRPDGIAYVVISDNNSREYVSPGSYILED